MTPTDLLTLNPADFQAACEVRLVELSRRLHADTREKAILEGELRGLRTGKSALAVKAVLLEAGVSL